MLKKGNKMYLLFVLGRVIHSIYFLLWIYFSRQKSSLLFLNIWGAQNLSTPILIVISTPILNQACFRIIYYTWHMFIDLVQCGSKKNIFYALPKLTISFLMDFVYYGYDPLIYHLGIWAKITIEYIEILYKLASLIS